MLNVRVKNSKEEKKKGGKRKPIKNEWMEGACKPDSSWRRRIPKFRLEASPRQADCTKKNVGLNR